MKSNLVGPIVVALAYIVLVVVVIFFIGGRTTDFDSYSKYWGLFGTLIGVATGAIPSFFFKAAADTAKAEADTAKAEADTAKAEADTARSTADQETAKVAILTRALPDDTRDRLAVDNPLMFR